MGASGDFVLKKEHAYYVLSSPVADEVVYIMVIIVILSCGEKIT